jgi:oxygen-independent coproporphyrinogen-3 oxidase
MNPNKVIEFTTEANPNHISQEYIDILKKHHVNRVSLGVQSFDEQKLQFLGRLHTKEEAITSVKLLQDNGINNVSIDLIYAIPNDTFKSVKNDLKIIKKLKINHVSAYSLILEEKTVLNYLHEKGKFKMLDEDAEFYIYKKLNRYLHRLGLKQYEVSNYAKSNFQGKHNLQYWNNYHYLGIGAGASYYIDNIRYTNVMNLEKYYEGINNNKLNYSEEIIVSKLEQMQEEMLMGLRKTIGVNIGHFKQKFNEDLFSTFPFITELIEQKLLKVKNNNIYIPKKKLYLSNSILIHFV